MRSLLPRLLATLALAGCGAGATLPPGTDGGAGGLSAEVALYDVTTMSLASVHDGDSVPLSYPPQGGFVIFVGARVRGSLEQQVELRARLRDATTMEVLAEDARTAQLQPAPDDPSVSIPDPRSYYNVPNVTVCPSLSMLDRFGRPHFLEVVVTEQASRRTVTVRRTVTPSCDTLPVDKQALCRCECAGGWTPTKCMGH